MKININNIPDEELKISLHKDGDWFRGLLPEKEKNDFSIEGIDVFCQAKRIRETVFIDGNLETTVTANCCRCLEVTHLPIKTSFRYTFLPEKKGSKQEDELSAEDLEYGYYQDDVIDLDNLIFEQVMLQIPIKVICTDACKGLCAHCGMNLNTACCNCHAEFIDERLAVLKKFRVGENKKI
ncbi:MAG: YceD family protein [Syntrophales bacterium]